MVSNSFIFFPTSVLQKNLRIVSWIGSAPNMREFYFVAISNGIENVRDKMSDQVMAEIPGPQTCSEADSEHTDNLRKWL